MKKMRCKNCVESYSTGSGSYHVALKSMYIRIGKDGKEWKKVGYWCPKCHRFYDL